MVYVYKVNETITKQKIFTMTSLFSYSDLLTFLPGVVLIGIAIGLLASQCLYNIVNNKLSN